MVLPLFNWHIKPIIDLIFVIFKYWNISSCLSIRGSYVPDGKQNGHVPIIMVSGSPLST